LLPLQALSENQNFMGAQNSHENGPSCPTVMKILPRMVVNRKDFSYGDWCKRPPRIKGIQYNFLVAKRLLRYDLQSSNAAIRGINHRQDSFYFHDGCSSFVSRKWNTTCKIFVVTEGAKVVKQSMVQESHGTWNLKFLDMAKIMLRSVVHPILGFPLNTTTRHTTRKLYIRLRPLVPGSVSAGTNVLI